MPPFFFVRSHKYNMDLTIVTPPTFVALADSEIREWLRIDPEVDFFSLTMLIASATNIVESITGLTIRQTGFQMTACAPDGVVVIPNSPIATIDAVQDATGPITGWTYANHVLTLPAPSMAVTIDFTCGWPTTLAIPQSIRHAIAVLVAAGYDARSEIDDQTMTTVMRLVAGQRVYLS